MVKKIVAACVFVTWLSPLPARAEISQRELEEMIAFVINVNGGLCAKVVQVNPLKLEDTYEVRCIEYRGGTGTVEYILNAREGKVFKR